MADLRAAGADILPAASDLLTSWWAPDLLMTPHPTCVAQGRVLQVVSERSLAYALGRLTEHVGPFRPTLKRLGAGSWHVAAEANDGALWICVPAAIDEPDAAHRSRRDLPLRIAENAETLLSTGLTRYLARPSHLVRLDGTLPVIVWPAEPGLRPLTFRDGRLAAFAQVSDGEDPKSEPPIRGPEEGSRMAALMTDVVAALVYHYRPGVDGGSAIADVVLGDGDFLIRSQTDGTTNLCLQLVRRLASEVSPEALLLQLVQLYAYESLRLGADELALPYLVSNPSIAFAGLVHGWRLRAADLGLSVDDATTEATDWIQRFVRSIGRSYRPWAERFLSGGLEPQFGLDLREGRTDLAPLRQRQHVLELHGRLLDRDSAAATAGDYRVYIDQRSQEMLAAGQRAATEPGATGRVLPVESEAEALSTCLTFEEYMDLCLHDPVWGYYGHRVEIGGEGHFDTHPEALSPDYGAWLAERAYAAWRDLVASGALGEADRFAMVEFGAGNGRLARDVLDAVRQRSASEEPAERAAWRAFEARLEYRIYELSAGLAERQWALLGGDAIVASGDARRPEESLRRDFPDGLRGLVVTNEVPDAFGVHKVLLPMSARAMAALVVPRLETALRIRLPGSLNRVIQEADGRMRRILALEAHAGEEFLDRDAFQALMVHLASVARAERDLVLAGLWFHEVYVRAERIPALAQHLAEHEGAYRHVLPGGGSDLPRYVNVHAAAFLRGLGASLAAGFVVTIDYGGSTAELARTAREGRMSLRTYGEPGGRYCPRVNDPYLAPGNQDLTADVDFSDLARVGRTVGLEVVHYGPETDLVGRALRDVLRTPEPFAPLLGEFGFKVLVQGTQKSEFFGSETVNGHELV